MKIKKVVSVLMSVLFVTTFIIGMSVSKTAVGMQAQNPTLKILMVYEPFDPNKDPAVDLIQKLTGYNTVYDTLPATNPDAKLMMEISGGESYDIMRVTPTQFSQLLGQNALMDLSGMIKNYGGNITKSVTPLGWTSVTKGGKKYGIPIEDGSATAKNPQGAVGNGIFIRTDLLKKLNLKEPRTIDELYKVMVAFKKAGYIPFTTFNAVVNCIASGFGLTGNDFVISNGKITSKLDSPAFKDYITFMNKCYSEGLIDTDFPINKAQNVQEKFANGKAAMMDLNFWEIPSVQQTLKKNIPTADVDLLQPLKDKTGKMNIGINPGAGFIAVIPKTAENAVAAVKYMNLLADPTIFKQTYIGIEGKHYEVKNGNYYPILPAFTQLVNSSQFTGNALPDYKYKLWQARARKTPEMATAYEAVNKGITNKNSNIISMPTSYASTLPSFQKYKMALDTMVYNYLVQLIAGGKPLSNYNSLVSQYKSSGGAKMVSDFNQWYNNTKIQILKAEKSK